MSDPKKDDKKEKNFLGKLVAAGMAILAFLVFIMYSNATIPEVVNQAALLMRNTGVALHGLANGTDVFASGGGDVIGSLIKIAVALVVVWMIGSLLKDYLKGGDTHDAHAVAKPTETKKADQGHH